MTTYLGKSCSFSASAFRKLPSIYVFNYFPFGFEGSMWVLIVSVPDHCLSFYFLYLRIILISCTNLRSDYWFKNKCIGYFQGVVFMITFQELGTSTAKYQECLYLDNSTLLLKYFLFVNQANRCPTYKYFPDFSLFWPAFCILVKREREREREKEREKNSACELS